MWATAGHSRSLTASSGQSLRGRRGPAGSSPALPASGGYAWPVPGAVRQFRDFTLRLMDKGIYMNPSATLHSLSSIAHTEADIAMTARAMAEVLEEMP